MNWYGFLYTGLYVLAESCRELKKIYGEEGEEFSKKYKEWKSCLLGFISIETKMRKKGMLDTIPNDMYEYIGDENIEKLAKEKLKCDVVGDKEFQRLFEYATWFVLYQAEKTKWVECGEPDIHVMRLAKGSWLLYHVAQYGIKKGFMKEGAADLYEEAELMDITKTLESMLGMMTKVVEVGEGIA